ncbi:SigE family RNA polymerase sigma factor [Nocardioides sp. Bht2]|uniref:SigE family RNA polymerase sigma factor n=1 Tax=Nocardioides sp. Bht2 TaxID=3392297 RepID=UPI0039B60E5E
MTEEEFDAFYNASFSRLTGQLHAMIGNRDEAQECVQEAFIRAWSRRKQFGEVTHPDAWIRTTAYRLAVSRWRRVKLARRAPDRALQHGDDAAGPDVNRVALIAALKQLPESQRRALVLHHLCDLSVQQVADETGVPPGTVKARLHRGRTALAALLDADAGPTQGAAHV